MLHLPLRSARHLGVRFPWFPFEFDPASINFLMSCNMALPIYIWYIYMVYIYIIYTSPFWKFWDGDFCTNGTKRPHKLGRWASLRFGKEPFDICLRLGHGLLQSVAFTLCPQWNIQMLGKDQGRSDRLVNMIYNIIG